MNQTGKCVICGVENGCGMLVMGQYICLDCQTLLDDPKRRVFGCANNRRVVNDKPKRMELVKTRE